MSVQSAMFLITGRAILEIVCLLNEDSVNSWKVEKQSMTGLDCRSLCRVNVRDEPSVTDVYRQGG